MADTTVITVPIASPPCGIIKEGHVSVRGHFMWRDRFVVVEHGRVTIMRSGKGAVKGKIDLLDANVRVVFHEDNAQVTIVTHAHSTVLNCGSPHERDEWVSALFTAKGGHAGDTDCEASDLVMSSMEEFEKELGSRHTLDKTSSVGSVERDSSIDDDSNDQEYNDTLLAFQDLRSSMMKCQRSLIDNDDEVCHSQVIDEQATANAHAHTDEAAIKQRNLSSIVAFIHSVQHGGRAVLLHLDVIESVCGTSLEEILSAIGDKQRDKQPSVSSATAAIGLQKLHVATFVRYILFHPVYSKRPEIQQRTAVIDALVDKYFPHCRLRRFSHDIEQGSSAHAFELDVSWQRKESESERTGSSTSSSSSSAPLHVARVAPLTMVKPDAAALKKKRHSFPNILLPLQIGGLTTQPSIGRLDSTTPLQAKRSSSDHLAEAATKNDSDCFLDEVLPEPLRNLLWKFSCQQVAEQLSIFHQQQLAKLTLWEFVHSPKHEAKGITDHFNRLVVYLVWSVLVEDTAKDRAEVIESIITIASTASTAPLNNFHLVMACVGCLGDTPLMPSRLPLTWKRVRSKFKTQLVALRTLCDHAGGFETLRKRQAAESSKGSCIPFIGVIGVTLERLRLVPYANETAGLLDVDKLDRQYLAVGGIESAMLRPYRIHDMDELQYWVRVKMAALDGFVSPRLLQLRSQQLLASETAQQSGSRHSSLYRSRNSPGSTGSADGVSDGGPSLLPFREICGLLVTTNDESERIQVCVEALLADDQQPLTQRLRKFHQDFKQSACHSACHVVLANVRNCVDALKRDMLAHKSFEIMQLTGLEDSSIQLERGLYMAIHLAVTKPIATWLFTKLRYAFVEEDARLLGLLESYRPDDTSSTRRRRGASWDHTAPSPVDLLESLADAFFEAIPQESDQTTRVRRAREILVSWTKTPFSVLCLLQQSLDVVFVPRDLRDALELLDTALSTLGGCKRLSSRASMVVTCGGASSNRGSMSSFGSFRSSTSSSSKRLLPPTTPTAECVC